MPFKLLPGHTISTVGDLLKAIVKNRGFPPANLFLWLPDSPAPVQANLQLRNFRYGGPDKVFILGGIEFDDYTFRCGNQEVSQRLCTNLRLREVRLSEGDFLRVSDRVYLVNDAFIFADDRLLATCSGSSILIRSAMERELLTFQPFSGMPIVCRFGLRAKCRDAVAFLQQLGQFQGSVIRLYFGSLQLASDDFLLSHAKYSRRKEFTFIAR
jgi:hypothetical protein